MNTWRVGVLVLGWVALSAVGEGAAADDGGGGQSSAQAADAGGKTSVAGEVDDLLTNNNLRAYSGSTSRWSIASQFNYEGGTLASPFSQDRPDISGASGTTTKTDLDGAVSAKYNFNARNSVMAGVGLRWIAPLTPGGPSNYNGTVFDVMNPYVQYQYIYKWFGIQSVLQAELMQWTQADQTALGYAQQFNVDQENMYEIGHTGISVGASTWVQYQVFDKSGSLGTPGAPGYVPDLAADQSVYSFGFTPELEYQLSARFNLRTVVSIATFEHYASDAGVFSFEQDAVYQSVGVGISVTRDIFLYPNIQFLPAQMEASLTNVGLGATINLF